MLYDYVTGPLALISLAIFFVGITVRVVLYIRGLDWRLDRVTYTVNVKYGIKGALRSLFFWMMPYGTRSWRVKPIVTFFVFSLHIGVLFTPIFLSAHNIILKEKFNFSFFTIPDALADILTIIVIVSAVVLLIRRLVLPEVRNITDFKDYMMIAITIAPFLTGFLAYHQAGDSQFWTIVHIISGEIMLVAIPFTKLSHFVMFFCTRVQIGMDYGIKRGGMKKGYSGQNW